MSERWHRWRHLAVQGLRHASRLTVLAVLVALVYLSLYGHYRAAGALEEEMTAGGARGVLLGAIDRWVGPGEDWQEKLDASGGTIWALRLGGVDLVDPLAAAEMTADSRTLYGPLLLAALIPVVVTLLLGRVFCSWMCPAGFLFELTDRLRGLLKLAEIRPADVRFWHGNKYVLLAVGLLAGVIVGLPLFALVYPPAVVSRALHAWIYGTSLGAMLLLLGFLVAVEVLVSRRWWCRYICPGGALYGLLGSVRLLRVKLRAESCTLCRQCEPVCPVGIDPIDQSRGIECDNCGVCLRHCPERALHFGVGLPGRRNPEPVVKERSLARRPAAVAVLAVLCLSTSAGGHHILGLPHYSYKENYPQVPTLEYPASTGPYDLVMTSFPGRPIPGEAANVSFYIKNRETGEPYGEPVTVRVLQTFTFGENREVMAAHAVTPLDTTHKLTVTFPDHGEFIVELTLQVEGQTEVIPFLMVAGRPSATVSILVALAAALGLFVLVVRAIRIKRARRAARDRRGSAA